MNRTILVALTFVILSSSIIAAEISVAVTNPLKTERNGAIVSINWDELGNKLEGISSANVRLLDSNGKVIISQVVDSDGNGNPDELLFLADFKGGESKSFKVVMDESLKIPETDNKTFARFIPERKDDFAWENDLIAFRVYGPAFKNGNENCGIDCWLKRVKYPIIDKWYEKTLSKKGSYHEDSGEGCDPYHVGSTLGCGGSAVWDNEKLNKPNVYVGWKIFANGPIRTVFELTYGPWDVNGKTVLEKKRITIDIGQRLFKIEESYFVNDKPSSLDIAVGVSTHDGKAKATIDKKSGILYCWETIKKNGDLGTGIIVSPRLIKEDKLIKSKKKDGSHAMFIVKTPKNGKLTYYAGYGWAKAKEITTPEQWDEYLKKFKGNLEIPLTVLIK